MGSVLVVVHFSYALTREYLMNTTLLAEYERVAEDACGRARLVQPDSR